MEVASNDNLYDEFYASVYDEIWLCEKYGREVEKIKEFVSSGRLLDVGCGTGTHCALLDGTFVVEGYDISDPMLRRAREKNPGMRFFQGSMVKVEVGSCQQYDVITCLNSALNYLKDESEYRMAFKEFSMKLNKGGFLFLASMVKDRLGEDEWPETRSSTHVTRKLVHKNKWLGGGSERPVYHEEITIGTQVFCKDHQFFLPSLSVMSDWLKSAGFRILEVWPLPEPWEDEVVFIARKGSDSTNL